MNLSRRYIFIGSCILFLAVAIGAFGAHALKDIVIGKYLITFKTGGQYHFYHGLALIFIGLLKKVSPKIEVNFVFNSFFMGILLFSFNCYLYAITQMKIFAMIVPVGGVLFLMGWLKLAITIYKENE